MQQREFADFALATAKKLGADDAQITLSVSEKQEFGVAAGEISLYRTVLNDSLAIRILKNHRQGESRTNILDRTAIEESIQEALSIAEGSKEDTCYQISPLQKSACFSHGISIHNPDQMHARLKEFLDTTKSRFPKIILEEVNFDFSKTKTILLNSNGVNLENTQGCYHFFPMFTAKDGKKSSSFNYTSGSMLKLDIPFMDQFGVAEIMRQSSEQLEPKSVPEKFKGDLILSPHALSDFLSLYLSFLRDGYVISGSSPFLGKLGQSIAHSKFTVESNCLDEAFMQKEFFDSEGFVSEPFSVIEQGVLRSYLLSDYAARKTKLERAKNSGSLLSIAAGDSSYAEILKNVKRGILMTRFSGSRPTESGDLSGVAKNSYYIEDGKIQFPISETTISGNLIGFFKNLNGISRERISFGTSHIPYVSGEGFTISGK